MTIQAPPYIPLLQLKKTPISYPWDDWNPYQVIGDADPATEQALCQLSERAILAYAISCAEWVVFRLEDKLSDERPLEFIEACWAFEMSQEFRCPPESNAQEWQGPIRGVVDLALMTIINTIYAMEDDSAHLDASFAEVIAIHVLPNQDLFFNWRTRILQQLMRTHSRSDNDSVGKPVAREALDPDYHLSAQLEVKLVEQFLSSVSSSKNRFLRYANEITDSD